MKHFVLVGNPNCGKTTLYNALTGSNAHVGNWPGVTVEKREGDYKKLDELISIVDLPGIYSLSPYTPEEVISRKFIVDDKPDCVINIVDATNLERNLYLTTQVMEMDVPMVIALNMMDVVYRNGDSIDIKALEKAIGVPIVAISAQKQTNLDELMQIAYNESKKKRDGITVLDSCPIKDCIYEVRDLLKNEGVSSPLYTAIKVVEDDSIEKKNYPNAYELVLKYKESFNDPLFKNDLEAIIADSRYNYITSNYSIHKKTNKIADVENSSYKIDKVFTNKWIGIPIFLLILFLVFHFTFSENLFFLGIFFKNVSPSFEGSMFEGLFYTSNGINSLGVILQNFVTNITDQLSNVVSGWLVDAPNWISGLLVDGVLAGVFAVLSFVPQILLLFLFFSILEDTGYMARIAFILDRLFRKFGLSGRAFLPMIMGFGCSVPAMINTRTLADEKERIATIRVIPFFSCGAKLPILTAIAGGVCQMIGLSNVDIITFSMYCLGIVTAIVCVLLMRSTSLRGKTPPFIMELPNYHLPQAKALMIHLWDKLKGYVKKAFTIILASTIVIWFLQSFTFDWKYIEQANINDITNETFEEYIKNDENIIKLANLNDEYVSNNEVIISLDDLINDYNESNDLNYKNILNEIFELSFSNYEEIINNPDYHDSKDSILAGFGKLINPIFTPLGFGSQLNDNGWIYGVSAITGLIAKENVIATFTVLSESISSSNIETKEDYYEFYLASIDEEGIESTIKTAESTGIVKNGFVGYSVLIAFIVFNMTTIPCFATVATAKGELINKRKFWFTILFWLGVSFVVSSMTYLILSKWWFIFIFMAICAICGITIHLINKKRDLEGKEVIS